jgi:aminopeptidase YwaD
MRHLGWEGHRASRREPKLPIDFMELTMRALTTASVTLSLGLALSGCSDAGPYPGEEADLATGVEEAGLIGGPHWTGADPMAHIQFLSADFMNGRNTPSLDLDKAANYVKKFLTVNRLTDVNPSDPGAPYAQTFQIASFSPTALLEHAHPSGEVGFGHELFEEAFYLDEKTSPDAHRLINRRYEEAAQAEGRALATRASSAPRPLVELHSAAMLAGATQNVLGKLEGTGANSDKIIVVMAHLDHVGVSRSVVYNGADDNASGSSVILSSIPALAALQRSGGLNRSVLFLWTAGEEKGLVGAKYFVDHPIAGVGLSSIEGVINLDMVGRWDDQRLSIIDTAGDGSANYFRGLLDTANASLPDPFDRLNRDIDSYINRQDGWAFLNRGESVLMMFEGLSNPMGGGSLIPEYHASGDDIDKIIEDNGGNKPGRVRDLLVEVVRLAANR